MHKATILSQKQIAVVWDHLCSMYAKFSEKLRKILLLGCPLTELISNKLPNCNVILIISNRRDAGKLNAV